MRDDPDDLVARIDELVDDDEGLDDWSYPWSDAMRWAPEHIGLPEGVWDDQPEGELDSGWDYHPPAQIHVIPSDQVDEWVRCLEAIPVVEREDVQWFVVCFGCLAVGERSVDCGCGNPSSATISR
ncbi:hypothetical protein I3U71_24620 [Mycobacteroides abscessus subsp. massiliense]|nr:hypothetical protein [Mycobacteroides abscessus subsp. massiliense]